MSEYTNYKKDEIGELYGRMKKEKGVGEVVMEGSVEYLSFESVMEAMMYVYEVLLSQEGGRYSGVFSMRIFSCMESQRVSGLFEKKLFE